MGYLSNAEVHSSTNSDAITGVSNLDGITGISAGSIKISRNSGSITDNAIVGSASSVGGIVDYSTTTPG